MLPTDPHSTPCKPNTLWELAHKGLGASSFGVVGKPIGNVEQGRFYQTAIYTGMFYKFIEYPYKTMRSA